MISEEILRGNIAQAMAKNAAARPLLVPVNNKKVMEPDGSLYSLDISDKDAIMYMNSFKAYLKGLGRFVADRNTMLISKTRSYFRGYFGQNDPVGDFTPFNNPFLNALLWTHMHLPATLRQNVFYDKEGNAVAVVLSDGSKYVAKFPSVVPVLIDTLHVEMAVAYGTEYIKKSIPMSIFDYVADKWAKEERAKKLVEKSLRDARRGTKKNVSNNASASR